MLNFRENADYKSLGKHGLAIIGSNDLNLFEIISYKEKNNIIFRRNINSGFKFYNQKDWFSSFYDNSNQNWLVKFDSSNDQNEFCKEIQNRGSEIIINIDASFSTRSNISQKSVSKPDLSPRESAVPLKPENLPSLSLTVAKDGEETNSDSSSSHKRANILSRMAKMGQQILPSDILKNTSTDVSDSEIDDSISDHKIPPRKFKRAVPLEKHVSKEERLIQTNYLDSQAIPTQCSNISHPQPNMVSSFPQSVIGTSPQHMLTPFLMNQSLPYDGFQQYLVLQNAELKMNLAQLSSKLDSVLSMGSKGDIKTDDSNMKSKIKTLELRSENLLTELERYEKMYDDLQNKCKKLEDTESEINKSVIENLNKHIEDLKESLKRAEEKNSNYEKLEEDLEKYKIDVQHLEKTVEVQALKLKDLEEFYEENKDKQNHQQTIDTLDDTVTNLKLKLKDFEEQFLKTEAERQKRIEEREQNINTFSDNIKNHMNGMYQSILANFEEEDQTYSVAQIKSHVVQNLKGTTFAIIKEFRDIYKAEDPSFSDQ